MEWIESLPLALAFVFLYLVVLSRAGGTYLLGRLAHHLADRGRLHTFLNSERTTRARRVVNTYGAPVVAVSFLTIGFQTAVNAAAGLTRMPLRRYLPALLIGGAVWALLYATVGLAVIWLWLDLLWTSPWAAVAVVILVCAVTTWWWVRRRRRHNADPSAHTR